MYDEIMNRPMFQTPQQRQGAGIMAGVAPIRGYADGDLVEDDDSMIASLLAQAEELPESLSNLTMEDAVGYVKENPEILFTAIPGLGAAGVAIRFGPGAARGAVSLGRRLLTKKKARKATEADIMGNVPARKAPKGLSAEQQAEGIMGLPTKAAGAAKETVAKTGPGKFRRAAGKTALGGGLATLASVLPYELIPEGVKDYAGEIYEDYVPESLKEYISPDVGERVEFTDPAAKRLDEALKSKAAGYPGEKPVVQQGPPPPPPDSTFLGMLKGAGGRVLEGLQDPATRYALAKAAQPSEGFVPRDFFSDFALGKEEYKTIEAARDDETALEQNLKLLRREKPEASVDELLNLLLSKDTASELAQQVRTQTLSLFGELRGDDMNTNVSDAELMARAQNIVFGTMTGGVPAAASQGETIDLEVSE